MLHTKICDLLGIELPIMSAGMGGVATARLAAAVSAAGAIGTIALAGLGPTAAHNEIAAARSLTKKPLAVNLLIPFLRDGVIDVVAKEPIQAVTFFWGDPNEYHEPISRLRGAGIRTIWQCGTADEARAAREAGVDAVMVQGMEAGGHVRGEATTFALLPEVRDAIGEMPIIAAGGIADGRGLVAAFALGADAAAIGTRFLASEECAAHPDYKRRILAAGSGDTVRTTMFDEGWPGAPHRVLRSSAVEQWKRAGRPAAGKRAGEGERVAIIRRGAAEFPVPRYSTITPSEDVEGEIDALPFYAGQSCGIVREILPAGEIVRRIAEEAREIIRGRLSRIAD